MFSTAFIALVTAWGAVFDERLACTAPPASTQLAVQPLVRAGAELGEQLRRLGVEVVDVAPEHFASAVSDRYLALKAAGRL